MCVLFLCHPLLLNSLYSCYSDSHQRSTYDPPLPDENETTRSRLQLVAFLYAPPLTPPPSLHSLTQFSTSKRVTKRLRPENCIWHCVAQICHLSGHLLSCFMWLLRRLLCLLRFLSSATTITDTLQLWLAKRVPPSFTFYCLPSYSPIYSGSFANCHPI